MLSISGIPAYIFSDIGASHSFISPSFVERTGLVLRQLDKLLEEDAN